MTQKYEFYGEFSYFLGKTEQLLAKLSHIFVEKLKTEAKKLRVSEGWASYVLPKSAQKSLS